MAPKRKLGEILLASGVIDEIQLRSAMGHQKNWGGKLGSALIDLGFTTEEAIAKVLGEQLRQPCLGVHDLMPEPDALKVMSVQDALKYVVLPLKVDSRELVIAMSDPSDLALTDEVGFKVGKKVKGVLAVESAIKKAIKDCYYGRGVTGREYKVEIKDSQPGEAKIIHYDGTPVDDSGQHAVSQKVEPSADLIARSVAYLLIEKGIIKREELIEKMRIIKEKG